MHRKRLHILICMIVALACSGVRAAVLWVDADAPAGGDGSQEAPLSSLADLKQTIGPIAASGGVVHLRGEFRETVQLVSLRNWTLTSWDPEVPWILRGDRVVPPAQWIDNNDGTFTAALPPGEILSTVVWNWDKNFDPDGAITGIPGAHFGHLREHNSMASVASNAGSWFQQGAQVTIHPPPDAAPPTTPGADVYAWVGNERWGLGLAYCAGVIVENMHGYLWSGNISSIGYAIRAEVCTDCTFRDCVAYDCGVHSFGFTTTNVPVDNAGNTMLRLQCFGLHGGPFGQNHLVFFNASSTTPAFTTDCAAIDCDLHLYGTLDWTGASLNSNRNIIGTFQHTGHQAGQIKDLEWRDIRCYGYDGHLSAPIGDSGNSVDAADPSLAESFPVRYVRLRAINCTGFSMARKAHAAFIQCDFDLTRRNLEPIGLTVGGIGAHIAIGAGLRDGEGSLLHFESCIIRGSGASTSHVSFMLITRSARVDLAESNTLYFDGVAQSTTNEIFWVGADASVAASGAIFARASSGELISGAGATAQAVDFKHCWYNNIDPGAYAASGPLRTKADWLTLIDPDGVYDITPGFRDAPRDLEGTPGSPIRNSQNILPESARPGVNGFSYDGRYGAFQYGSMGDLNRDGNLTGIDLAIMLGAWGPCQAGAPCDADLSGDQRVNALDLAILLGAWNTATP